MLRSSQFKMVLLGESSVGKSSLALRFTKGQYRDDAESTIGAAFLTHTVQIDNDTSVRVELWDTAGQERYHSLAPMYYRGAQAALVVYDITNSESYRRAKMWVRELRQANGGDIVLGLAGNKVDIATGSSRQVDARESAEYAEENGVTFLETSAKRGDNVLEMFMSVAKQVVAKQPTNTFSRTNERIQPTKPNASDKGGGCCGGSKKTKQNSES